METDFVSSKVKCANCGKSITVDEAEKYKSLGDHPYFCSDRCREKHRSNHPDDFEDEYVDEEE